jgi:hypothetical protein
MLGNISVLCCSFLFISILITYFAKLQADFDIIDLYILFVLLHFGLYPFVRGLYFGSDVIFDFRDANPVVIGLIFGQVLLALVIIRVASWYFPKNIAEYLNMRNLIQQWSQINRYILLGIYVGLIVFQIISYYKYGVKTYILHDDFERIGKQLPYWFFSVRTIYPLLAFLTFLGLFSLILKTTGYRRSGWILLTLLFVPVVTIYGRRFFLAMIVAAAVFWFIDRRKNLFRVKYLTAGLVLVCGFLVFSNLFQAYREVFQAVGPVNLEKLPNPLAAAVNFNATINNLKKRPGTWEFNFLVLNNQYNKPDMSTHGQITWEGVKSSIPRVFWPGKQFSLIDDVLSGLYHVQRKQIDIGKNLFGVAQVDFGYLSIIIVPIVILTIVIVMGLLIKISAQYPTFLWLFTGNIVFFLINVEENGNEIFYMIRYVLITLMLFAAYRVTQRIYSLVIHK